MESESEPERQACSYITEGALQTRPVVGAIIAHALWYHCACWAGVHASQACELRTVTGRCGVHEEGLDGDHGYRR